MQQNKWLGMLHEEGISNPESLRELIWSEDKLI
jgi:hypothetical protein